MVGLFDGEKNFEDMYNRLDSIPACFRPTDDGQTDGQTSCRGIVCAMPTRCAVKKSRFSTNISVYLANDAR